MSVPYSVSLRRRPQGRRRFRPRMRCTTEDLHERSHVVQCTRRKEICYGCSLT